MIKQIEIVVSYSGKISKPKYENVEVFFSVKEIIENQMITDDGHPVVLDISDKQRNARMLQIKNDLQKMFEADYKRIHNEQEVTEEPKGGVAEETKERPPAVRLSDECIKLREDCYNIFLGKAEHSDFAKIKSDLWVKMKALGFTKDDLHDIKTWEKTKEALRASQNLKAI